MIKVLPQRGFVELAEKTQFDRGVELADFINQLTFGHRVLTFECLQLADVAEVPELSASASDEAELEHRRARNSGNFTSKSRNREE
jgi:hypothetical protein